MGHPDGLPDDIMVELDELSFDLDNDGLSDDTMQQASDPDYKDLPDDIMVELGKLYALDS